MREQLFTLLEHGYGVQIETANGKFEIHITCDETDIAGSKVRKITEKNLAYALADAYEAIEETYGFYND